MVTDKARQEVKKLQEEIQYLNRKRDTHMTKARITKNMRVKRMWRNDAAREENKVYKREEKVRDILKMGISTGEKRALINKLRDFDTISSERDIASTDFTKVGYDKNLGWIKIKGGKYNSYLSNVKGMKGLAGKRYIDDVKKITEKEAVKLLKKTRAHTTSFMGTETKQRKAPKIDIEAIKQRAMKPKRRRKRQVTK